MIYISDESIDRLIKEDAPYIDLTTIVLGIGEKKGRISFTTREETVLTGIEEVLRILGKLGISVKSYLPSGSCVPSGQTFLEAEGNALSLHMAWKVSLNIFEYCCGIATRTKKLVDKARAVNPKVSVVTTRKCFPGTKELAVKAIMHGGAYPHRLGLSETILIFKQHVGFLGGFETLAEQMDEIKSNACEKKVIVEVETLQEALVMAKAEADVLQFDKMTAEDLKEAAKKVREINPKITLIAAGGINESNVQAYAGTGVDVLNTTWVYFGKPSDIAVKIEPL